MRVNLIYFKHTGKYYSEGSYESQFESLLGIWPLPITDSEKEEESR